MIRYNVYHNGIKINKTPITSDDVEKIKTSSLVNKYDQRNHTLKTIPTAELEIIKCYMI